MPNMLTSLAALVLFDCFPNMQEFHLLTIEDRQNPQNTAVLVGYYGEF
jgi:hypothetical protein